MVEIDIREMNEADRREVAELICVSTNCWYEAHGMARIFPGGPESADIFYQVYGALEVRGEGAPFRGVSLPTFMPETG